MALVVKTLTELNNDTSSRLVGLGYTDAQYAGTGARSLLEATDIKLSDLYSMLSNDLQDYYLSQAGGSALDALVVLLGIYRRQGESDDNLRVRASKARTSAATGNLQSLTSALLSLSNVRDVIVRPFTYGIGSLTFYAIGTNGIVDAATLAMATQAIQANQAAGAYTVVTVPTSVQLNVTGTVLFNASVPMYQRQSVRNAAQAALATYISNLSMGDSFVVAKAIAVIMDAGGGQISDFTILTISTTAIDGTTREQLVRNYLPQFDEELIPGQILLS